MRIYLAGPLFCEAEKKFNEDLTHKLEGIGFDVFLPQRDGVEKDEEPYISMSVEERGKMIFEVDKDNVINSDILLFVLDGRVPDEGAAVELGIAYANQKTLVGFMTDKRHAFLDWKLNPMIGVPLEYIAENEEDLLAYLKEKSTHR